MLARRAVVWCPLVLALACVAGAQVPRRDDPFLVIDRIREPIPSFVDAASPLARLANPISGSLSAAGGVLAHTNADSLGNNAAFGVVRGHLSPSFAHVINWDVAGAASFLGHGVSGAFVQPSLSFGSDPSPSSLLALYGGAGTTNHQERDPVTGLQKAAWAGVSWTTPGWSPPAPTLRLRAIVSVQADWRADDPAGVQHRGEPRPHYGVSVPLLFNKLGVPGVLYSYERRAAFDDRPIDENDVSLLYDPKTLDAASHHVWTDRRFPALLAQFATLRHAGRRINELRLQLATTFFP